MTYAYIWLEMSKNHQNLRNIHVKLKRRYRQAQYGKSHTKVYCKAGNARI